MTSDRTYCVFTCDDVGHESQTHPVETFRKVFDLVQKLEVQGTFFVIPNDGGGPNGGDHPLNKNGELLEVLTSAHDAGHELGMHGYKHYYCEFGPPTDFVIRTNTTFEMLKELKEKEREIMANLSYDAQVANIRSGQQIFESALGLRPEGFRAGWGSISDPTFKALSQRGFSYDSSLYAGRNTKFNHPYLLQGNLVEVPIRDDFSWCLLRSDLPTSLENAKKDFDLASERGEPYAISSHHWAMGRYMRLNTEYDFTAGLELIEKFVKYIAGKSNVEFVTVSELVKICRKEGL